MNEQLGLEISKDVWKFFIKAHPDCDTDAFVDEIVAGCEALCQARVERLIESIKNMESPFAFSLDGKPIPKWEKQFDGFEEAREMISQAIKNEYLSEQEGVDDDL